MPAEETQSADAAAPVTPRVLVFFDYACQFCYLDWPRLKRLRREHGAELFLVPYELHPELPSEGASLSGLGLGHSERVEEHMRHMAREGGLSLASPEFLPNTHLALALGEYGRDLGPEKHESLHEAIFAAYSGAAEDIGSRDVLFGVARANGLDAEDVARALGEGRFDERLRHFRELALSLGISATPAALICNELLIGTRPYQVLAHALEHCLVDEHSLEAHDAGTSGSDERAESPEGAPPGSTSRDR